MCFTKPSKFTPWDSKVGLSQIQKNLTKQLSLHVKKYPIQTSLVLPEYITGEEDSPYAFHTYAFISDPCKHIFPSASIVWSQWTMYTTTLMSFYQSMSSRRHWSITSKCGEIKDVIRPHKFRYYDLASIQSQNTCFDTWNVSTVQWLFTVIGPMDDMEQIPCKENMYCVR